MNMKYLKLLYLFMLLTSCSSYALDEKTEQDDLFVTFCAVQKINALCAIIADQANKHHDIDLEAIGGNQEPSRGWSNTSQGLFLISYAYPEKLCTPWGDIKLFARDSIQQVPIGYIDKELRKYVGTEIRISSRKRDWPSVHAITSINNIDLPEPSYDFGEIDGILVLKWREFKDIHAHDIQAQEELARFKKRITAQMQSE
jgi:hypothetical protein